MKYTWKEWKFLLRKRWPIYLNGFFLGLVILLSGLISYALGFHHLLAVTELATGVTTIIFMLFQLEDYLDKSKYQTPLLWIQAGQPSENYPADEIEKQWLRADLVRCMEKSAVSFAIECLRQKTYEAAIKDAEDDLAKFEASQNPMCPREFYDARDARQDRINFIKQITRYKRELGKVVINAKVEFYQHWRLIEALGLQLPVDDKGKYIEMIEKTDDYRSRSDEAKKQLLSFIDQLRRMPASA